jgi:hypothetical protein
LDGQLCERNALLVSEERYLAGNRISMRTSATNVITGNQANAGSPGKVSLAVSVTAA